MIYSLPFDLATVAFFLVLSTAIGGKILQKTLRFVLPSPGISFVFNAGAGLAFLSFLTFAIGIFGGLYRSLLWAVLAALLLWVISDLKSGGICIRETVRSLK